MIKSAHANILETSNVSLAAGTEDPYFPLHRLYDRNIGRLFRPTLAETVEILLDQGDSPKNVDRLLVPHGHNLDGVAVDLRYSDDDATYLSALGADEFGSETEQNLKYRSEESDEFGINTQQDLKVGGDGAKQYGWNVLNSANADIINVNTTNAGKLTIDCNAVNSKLGGSDFTCPFVYRELAGDFDIETSHTDNSNENFEDAGFLVRDPNASGGEDWIGIFYRASDEEVYRGNTVNSISNWESDMDVHRFLRIKRIGNVFTLYSKANAGDSWIERSQFARNDIGTTVQAGVFARTGNTNNDFVAQFDYFRSHGDGARQHGWNILNSSSAEVIDVNQSNAGKLTIRCNAVSSKINNGVFSVPFVYKEITGDFDIATFHTDNGYQNFEDAGIVVRDPTASLGEDWMGIFYRPVHGKIWIGKTSSSVTFWQDGGINAHRYLRIKRDGNIFIFYSKATAVDSWTERAKYIRSDFDSTVHLGVFAATQNTSGTFVVQFDWFRHVASSDIINHSFAQTPHRYWRFMILEPAVVPEVSEVFLTETHDWLRNPSRPCGPFDPEFNVYNEVTSGGQDRFLVCGNPKRRRFYNMPVCSETQKGNIIALYDAWGGSKPFWLLDHEGDWIYGKLRSPLNLREEAYRKYSFDFDFAEVLP